MIGTCTTARPTAIKFWQIPFIALITFLIYHRATLLSTTSSVQFAFGFSQYQQQKHVSYSLLRNQDRTLRNNYNIATTSKAHRPSVMVQRSYVISMISDLQQPESSQRWFMKIDPRITYRRLRRCYTQNLCLLLHQSKNMILSFRCYLWFVALFLSWNIAIPNAIATTKTTTMTTRMLKSIRPPQTNSIMNDGTLTNHHHDTGTFNMIGTSKHEGNSFHINPDGHKNNNQRQIRFITTSAVILATSAVGVNKVNRKKQTNDNSMESKDDPTIVMGDQDVTTTSGSELAWLLPKNDDIGSSEDKARAGAGSVSNIGIAKPSSTPIFVSQRTNDITNAVERLKQVSLPPTKTESSWFAKSVVKSVLPKQQQQQQPKSLQDELQLQAKYASIESLEERAYTILVDLGMVEEPTPQDPFDSAWE